MKKRDADENQEKSTVCVMPWSEDERVGERVKRKKEKQNKNYKRKIKEKQEWCRVCLARCLQQFDCCYYSSFISLAGPRPACLFHMILISVSNVLPNRGWVPLFFGMTKF